MQYPETDLFQTNLTSQTKQCRKDFFFSYTHLLIILRASCLHLYSLLSREPPRFAKNPGSSCLYSFVFPAVKATHTLFLLSGISALISRAIVSSPEYAYTQLLLTLFPPLKTGSQGCVNIIVASDLGCKIHLPSHSLRPPVPSHGARSCYQWVSLSKSWVHLETADLRDLTKNGTRVGL